MRAIIVITSLLCLGSAASAQVFKCSYAGGQIEYQSVPCTTGKTTALRGVDRSPTPDDPASAARNGGLAPEIVGSERFQTRVRDALALLRSRDAAAYAIVAGYVGRIEQSARSGMRAYADPPTFFLTEKDAMYSTEWAAAVIAHDSYHSKLYFDYRASHTSDVPAQAWGGTQSEIKCMRHQLAVMRRIGSSQWEIDHALLDADGHHVNDWDYHGSSR